MAKKNSKKTVPELRFRGFTDPWEQRQLGEVVSERNILRSKGAGYPLVSFTVKDGVTPKTERYDREQLVIGDTSKKLYKETRLDDIVYNPANLKFGAIARNKYGNAVFSPIYITLEACPSVVSPAFVEMLVTRRDFINRALKYQQGTVYERMAVSVEDLVKMNIRVPSLPEQRRIGGFFSTLDSLIAAAERQEALLKQKKQAYLQLMFPQEGETQSRLRFAGFSGDWEKRQLGELAERTGSGGTPSSANPRYYGGSIPFLSIGDITGRFVDTTQKTLTEEGLTNSAAWVVPQGAISLAMYASYGKSAILSRPMATSQAFFNVVFTSDATRDFIYSRFQCAEVRHEWDAMVSTGTQPNLSGSKLKKWEISLPPLPEQRLIGQFFKTFDSLIAAAEERTRALKETKSAYLQRMFV